MLYTYAAPARAPCTPGMEVALAEFGNLSSRQIAEMCGVSDPFVGSIRQLLTVSTSPPHRLDTLGRMQPATRPRAAERTLEMDARRAVTDSACTRRRSMLHFRAGRFAPPSAAPTLTGERRFPQGGPSQRPPVRTRASVRFRACPLPDVLRPSSVMTP